MKELNFEKPNFSNNLSNISNIGCNVCDQNGWLIHNSPEPKYLVTTKYPSGNFYMRCICNRDDLDKNKLDSSNIKRVDKTFDNISLNSTNAKSGLEVCKNWADDKFPNLLIAGRSLSGKTHLAKATVHYLTNLNKSAHYVTYTDLYDEITGYENIKELSEKAARYITFDYFVFDGIPWNVQKITDHYIKFLERIIVERYDNKKSTFITSAPK